MKIPVLTAGVIRVPWIIGSIFLHPKKFCDYRVFNEFKLVLIRTRQFFHFRFNFFLRLPSMRVRANYGIVRGSGSYEVQEFSSGAEGENYLDVDSYEALFNEYYATIDNDAIQKKSDQAQKDLKSAQIHRWGWRDVYRRDRRKLHPCDGWKVRVVK